MKNIFIIDGAAGTGKTDLIQYLNRKFSKSSEIGYLRKYTTRGKRPEEKEEDLDLYRATKIEFDKMLEEDDFYDYSYGKYDYGFYK